MMGGVALFYSYGGFGKCGDILDEYEDDINEVMEAIEYYDGDSNREQMSLLEGAEDKMFELQDKLEDGGCI